jgi:hypothetical protein
MSNREDQTLFNPFNSRLGAKSALCFYLKNRVKRATECLRFAKQNMPTNPLAVPADSDAAATMLSRHTLPVGIKAGSVDFPWDGAKRATITLLRLAKRHVFITCFHVFRKLREMQAHDPSAEMVAYLAPVTPLVELKGFTLIDHDERSLDVAIFRGLEDTVELPGARFIDYASSYLADPIPGESVIIVGYPAANITVRPNKADFGFMQMVLRASSISERQIKLADEHGDRRFFDFNDPARLRIDLGGLSGSPAFVIRDQRHRFVGIVTDCSERDQIIIISRLGCINPDGTLNHTAIAW